MNHLRWSVVCATGASPMLQTGDGLATCSFRLFLSFPSFPSHSLYTFLPLLRFKRRIHEWVCDIRNSGGGKSHRNQNYLNEIKFTPNSSGIWREREGEREENLIQSWNIPTIQLNVLNESGRMNGMNGSKRENSWRKKEYLEKEWEK